MRRLPVLLATVLLAVPSAAAGASAAAPTEVPAALLAAARSPAGSPCSLMTRDLREQIAIDELLTNDPTAREPWTPEDVMRVCDGAIRRVASARRKASYERPDWLAQGIEPARVVATRGDTVRLRARLLGSTSEQRARRLEHVVVNVFVVREDGVWRMAAIGEVEPHHFALRVETPIARFDRDRSEQNARTRGLLRARVRFVGELATAPRPLAPATLACETGANAARSGRSELSGRRPSGVARLGVDDALVPVHGPRAARIDLVDARLSSGRGRLCWTFRLRGPVAERVDFELLLSQRGDDDRSTVWTLRLDGGRAVGVLEPAYGARRAFALRASVHGRVVRVVVPASQVRGPVRTGRPFGWSVWTRTPDPDRPPLSGVQWIDTLPGFDTWDDLAGIEHRPRR